MNAIHKNCFAYQSDSLNGCAALKELYCRNEECKFFKLKRDGNYHHKTKNSAEKEIKI